MKRVYVKPESEYLIICEGILEDVPFSNGGEFETNTGKFESEIDEKQFSSSSSSLWDE